MAKFDLATRATHLVNMANATRTRRRANARSPWLAKPKLKTKSAKSRTKTKTKTRKFQNVPSVSTGLSYSKCLVKYKQMKGFATATKTAARDVFRVSDRFYATSLIGQQGAHNIYHQIPNGIVADNTGLLTLEHLKNLMAQCVRLDVNTENTFGVTPGKSNQKLWLDKLEVKTLYTNQGPGTVVMYIYDCIANSDRSSTPRVDWDVGLDDAEGTGVYTDSSTSANFGGRPTEMPFFNRCWKIKKISRIELHTGGSHQHTFTFNYNGLLPSQALLDDVGSNNIRGITCNQLLITHGVPVDNTNAFALNAGSSDVSIDQTKVVGTTTATAYTRLITSKPRKVYAINQLPPSNVMLNAFIQSEKDQTILNSFTTTNFA